MLPAKQDAGKPQVIVQYLEIVSREGVNGYQGQRKQQRGEGCQTAHLPWRDTTNLLRPSKEDSWGMDTQNLLSFRPEPPPGDTSG